MELENLQSNPASANKFARHCYEKVKQILVSEFSRFRPEFNIIFDDGKKVANNPNPEFIYHISAINGLDNLSRANPNFVVAVILVHKDGEKEEAISVALNNVFSKEIYHCEKGFGAYVNNRKIKVSKRKDNKLAFVSNVANMKDKVKFNQALGSAALEVAYLASGKAEIGVFDNNALNQNLLLLFKEAGGKVEEHNNLLIAKSE
jgi:myo-inositol-1(or 4)-monophosphatase